MPVTLTLRGHDKDLGGGFQVRRLLPDARRQSVGPFLFFDHFGPVTLQPGSTHDVRPHPHIGLATVTYLFDGAIMHRDSLGFSQRIEPGAINWMTAGRGIVHSERAPDDLKSQTYVNHGIQLWAALPRAHEEVAPDFVHTPAVDIPVLQMRDATVRVLVGDAYGQSSPVRTFSRTLYLDIQLAAGAVFELPPLAEELALYVVEGALMVDGEPVAVHTLVLLEPGLTATVEAGDASRLMVIGGDTLPERRFMWWNFVSSRQERIVQAAQDWEQQAMGRVAGDDELIALPERRFSPD
ncbi:MAG: pirin family protein [Polaromonas sp.]|uniref:pirin family protein n=1 Tax=Polaromonas sp. TaxID=1869339 RepID=UPI002735BE3C|nr:pirin family protein [Polaromonas sp.]MDP1956461.1 pirin family protein [Polaromonas sp.]MDP3797238.1 pirin family protein [Polaromonas sp.]